MFFRLYFVILADLLKSVTKQHFVQLFVDCSKFNQFFSPYFLARILKYCNKFGGLDSLNQNIDRQTDRLILQWKHAAKTRVITFQSRIKKLVQTAFITIVLLQETYRFFFFFIIIEF